MGKPEIKEIKPGIWMALQPASSVPKQSEKKVISVSPGILKWMQK